MILLRGKALENRLERPTTCKHCAKPLSAEPIPLRQILFRSVGIKLTQMACRFEELTSIPGRLWRV
jgi:hypothetical protein